MIEKSQKGFTLVELIVSVAILSILATSVIIITNPAELMKQARDSRRISDLTALSTAISFYTNSVSPPNMDGVGNSTCKDGSNKKVYVSVPNSQTPPSNLPPGWSYGQTSETNLKKVNGTGWIPINFTSVIGGPPISALPTDPVNSFSKNLFYSYTCSSNGNFELTARFESKKYNLNGSNPQTVLDGGTDRTIYEVGSDLTLDPFSPVLELSFDEGTGTIAYDSSGNNNHGTLYNGPQWVDGKVGKALSFDGVDDYVSGSGLPQVRGPWTLCAWANPRDFNATGYYNVIVNNHSGCGGVTLGPSNSGSLPMHFSCVTAGDVNLIMSLNSWQFVCFSYDNINTSRLVLNSNFTSVTGSYTPLASDGGFKIGSREPSHDLFFNGLIDEVRIYNRALSDTEIKALYEATK